MTITDTDMRELAHFWQGDGGSEEVGGGSNLAVRVESRIFWQRVPCQNRYVTCPTPQSLKCLPRKTGSNDMGSGVFWGGPA